MKIGAEPYAAHPRAFQGNSVERVPKRLFGAPQLTVPTGALGKRRQQADIDRPVALHMEYKSRKAPKAAANKAEKRKR